MRTAYVSLGPVTGTADLIASDGLDEVVVTGAAVGALNRERELRKAQSDLGWIDQLLLALVALHAPRAARETGKEIVRVHRAYLVMVAVPHGRTEPTGDPVDADQAFETDSRQIGGVITFTLHFQGGVVWFERREIEGSIDEGKLIVDGEF